MDTQAVESNEKTRNDRIEPEQNRRMPSDAPDEPKTTKITDLNKKCLGLIFKHLRIKDLLSLADTSKYFKRSVDDEYKRKYGNATVTISLRRDDDFEPISFWCNHISVNGPLFSLRFLRCFGHMVSDLQIIYNYRHLSMVDQYIYNYCSNSLNKISLDKAGEKVMEHLTKPFPKIEQVSLVDCDPDSSSFDLKMLFPQMEDLAMCSYNKFNTHFPNLKRLEIGELASCMVDVSDARENVARILSLNPQLRSLILIGGDFLDITFVQSISEHLQNIERLNISSSDFFDARNDTIHLKNLECLELDLGFSYYDDIKMPFSFEKLKTFSIWISDFYITTEFIKFIGQHRSTLNKLCINTSSYMQRPFEKLDKEMLAGTIDQLMDIDLGKCNLSIQNVIDLLSICKMLKRLRFKLGWGTADDLLNNIGSEWRLSTEEHGFIVLQKQ